MPELPRRTNREPIYGLHLESAKANARQLDAERATDDAPLALRLQADQGYALRQLLYDCTAAIVAALREPPS